MNKKVKYVILLLVIIVIGISLFFISNNGYKDTVKYDGKVYALLEYNSDIFTYNHNSNSFYEEDIIHLVSHSKWKIVHFNGDLFVLKNDLKEATKYYSDDNNYDWFIVFDEDDTEIKRTISLTDSELNYLYNIENNKDKSTITFNDIDEFGDLLKISKDGLVQGIVTLVKVDGNWYYKTEVMNDEDREYVIKINNSLNDKINNLMIKE